jgi:uncharacterized RDD family membrane protein YckC
MVDAPLDTVLEIDTPEHLAFRTRLAGPGRRLLAWTLDLVVTAALTVGLLLIPLVLGAAGLEGFGSGVWLFGLFLLDWGYFFAWEMFTGGRSPGKIAFKLRVVRHDGLPVTWRESFLRNLLRAADIALFPPFFLLVGPLVMAIDPRFRRLGDLAAGTVVVTEAQAAIAGGSGPRPDPALLAELPSALALAPDDLEALELFVGRRHMTDARRQELAAMIAPLHAARLGLPAPRDPAAFLVALWTRSQDVSRRIA